MVQTAAGEMESGMFKHVYVDGTVRASNLEIIGEYVTLNTVTSNTEQVVVENAGTGPALKVTQTGVNSIAEFYDDGGVLALKIADGGNVGIGTSNPSAKLDVIGNIHLTGSIYKNGEVFNSSVGDSIPIGTIMPFYSTTVSDPSYLICNGGTYNRVDYIELANVLGVSPSATTFQVPDLREKFLLGSGATYALKTSGGSATRTLVEANMPAHSHSGTTTAGEGTHTHTITDPGHQHTLGFDNGAGEGTGEFGTNYQGVGGSYSALAASGAGRKLFANRNTTGISITSTNSAHTHTFTTNSKGSGTAFDILPPYTTVIYIIKAKNNQYITPIRDGDYWTNVSNKLIYQSGNVGIGTNNPQQLLDVNGNIHVQGAIQSQSQFLGQVADSANAPSYSFMNNSNTGIFRPAIDNIGFSCGGIEQVRILPNGNMGIGTGNPQTTLEIKGNLPYASMLTNPIKAGITISTTTGSERLHLGAYYTGGIGSACAIQASDFYNSIDHGQNLILNPLGGSVGIGTATPLHKLHVEGYSFSRNSYKSNVFYAPPNWSYSTTTTGSWVQLWSFTYTAPVEGYATISVAGHWSHGTNGMAPYLAPMINGNSIHQSVLYDAYTIGGAMIYGGTVHQYYYNTSVWWGFSQTANVKLSAATHTIGMGVFSGTAGTLSVNGAGITLNFYPKFLT
jgi:microcystin-dependent protein